MGDHQRLYSASLIVALTVAALIVMFLARIFALKAQDRAIRAEENLRHFALTGKLLDSRLTLRQIIGLRFAADGEFVSLAQKAADEKLSEDAIKRAIRQWRPDIPICNIGMPGMDRYETCRRLLQVPDLEKAAIAAVSGYGGP